MKEYVDMPDVRNFISLRAHHSMPTIRNKDVDQNKRQ